MDKKSAKKLLLEHKNALETLLKSEGLGDVEAEIKQIQESASEGKKALKKSLLQRVKDFPVVDKISQLGTAGTVAVSTAAVTQADLAKDLTEVFVAEVANDVVEERFEVPDYFDNFIDFHVLNDWGQIVIAEKVEAAQGIVAEAKISVSEQSSSQPETPDSEDTKQASDASSDKTSDGTPDEQKDQGEEQKQEKEGSKEEGEEKSSEESKEDDQKEEKSDKQQQDQESKTEDTKESQEQSEPSPKPTQSVDRVNTPYEDPVGELKPHTNVVSPTS